MEYFSKITAAGEAKIRDSIIKGNKINFKYFAVGDGGGAVFDIDEKQEGLNNELWRGTINSIVNDPDNSGLLILETIVPADVGGFTIREGGVFDDEGCLIAIGKYPETYKPVSKSGALKELTIKLIIEFSADAQKSLNVDPSFQVATKRDLEGLEKRLSSTHISETQPQELYSNMLWLKPVGSKSIENVIGSMAHVNLEAYVGETPPEGENKVWFKPVAE